MTINKTILVVEDDNSLREALKDTLLLSNYTVLESKDATDALAIIMNNEVNLIISDVQMPGMNGFELLHTIKKQKPGIPVVLITAYGTVPKAVEAIQAGAADYIIKPFEAEVLIEMVNRLTSKVISTTHMVIADPRSQHITNLARRVADSNATVMISGDSGTGKEVFSQFIHKCSPRSDKPFLAINCAAIPESMLESILFGYEKGAFTGAYTARAGKFEQANKGTLLLDEISEMDLGLQSKLLRVIQEKEVERLGGSKTIPLDVRIIATTNRNLKAEVKAGNFREDLFYRLNVFPIHLPALKERPGDILPLAEKFIELYQPGKGIVLTQYAEQSLLKHNWQGNVRELENVIQRALILSNGIYIEHESIIFEDISETEHELTIETIEPLQESHSLLESDLKTREKEIIIDAVSNNHSRKEAAEKLGISPRTLRYKLAQFRKDGIAVPA